MWNIGEKGGVKPALLYSHGEMVSNDPKEDISCHGTGLLAYKIFEKGFKLQPNSEILLDFQLPPNYRWSGLRGRVIYQRSQGKAFTRIGVKIHPNLGQSHLLKQYIASQKVEIKSELDQIFIEALREPDVVDQFF